MGGQGLWTGHFLSVASFLPFCLHLCWALRYVFAFLFAFLWVVVDVLQLILVHISHALLSPPHFLHFPTFYTLTFSFCTLPYTCASLSHILSPHAPFTPHCHLPPHTTPHTPFLHVAHGIWPAQTDPSLSSPPFSHVPYMTVCCPATISFAFRNCLPPLPYYLGLLCLHACLSSLFSSGFLFGWTSVSVHCTALCLPLTLRARQTSWRAVCLHKQYKKKGPASILHHPTTKAGRRDRTLTCMGKEKSWQL